MTQWRGDTRLYLDGNIQFSSTDEFRYHESIVHPAMSAARRVNVTVSLAASCALNPKFCSRAPVTVANSFTRD